MSFYFARLISDIIFEHAHMLFIFCAQVYRKVIIAPAIGDKYIARPCSLLYWRVRKWHFITRPRNRYYNVQRAQKTYLSKHACKRYYF